MKLKRIAWTYLTGYLALGGIGFAFFPTETQKIFLSDIDYGNVMPRLVGVFMCLLSFIIFSMLRNKDWKYYPTTIIARIPVVLFIIYLYYISCNPMFLVINAIVILGLAMSVAGYFLNRKEKES